MSGKFFEAIKALFPHSRAFEMFADNNKRRLMQGLAALLEDIRHEAELVYFDLFPYSTRVPEMWESVFALIFKEKQLSKRRDVVDAMWKFISGDQGIGFLELILQRIDSRFHVVENIPFTDPRNKQSTGMAVCDYDYMVCDNEIACCDYMRGNDKFVPSILQNDTSHIYSIPDDTRYWETCFFVCRQVYRNKIHEILYIEPVVLEEIWRDIVEYLILKTKPLHTTAVLFVEWKQEAQV
jgi:hypothetical protein